MKRFVTTAAALALAAVLMVAPQLSSAQSGAAWATFHGNPSRNGVSTVNGPTGNFLANQWQLPKAAGSSVAVDANGIGYVGSADGKVYALDPAVTRAAKWSFKTGGPVFSGPTLSPDGKTLYVGSDDGNVYAISTASGTKVWQHAVRGPVRASPLLSGDGSTLFINDVLGNVIALKTSDGSVAWGPITFSPGGAIPGSLSLSPDGSTLYAATYAQLMFGFPTSGLQGSAQPTTFYLDGPASGSPAVDTNGNIYVTTGRGSLMSFAPGSNGGRWTFSVPNLPAVYSTAAIGSGLAIFGANDGTLYALNASNKDIAWTLKTAGPITSSPAISANGVVYVGSQDGTFYALNVTNGSTVWSRQLNAPISGSPAIAPDGSVWVGSDSGFVYRFKPAASPSGPPGSAGAAPTSTPNPIPTQAPGSLIITVRPQVKAGQRQNIVAKTSPRTLVRFRIAYPNGDHQSKALTSDAAGLLQYGFKQGPSKIKHNRFVATVTARASTGSASAQYRILYGKIDVSAEPRNPRARGIVNIYVHMPPRTRVSAFLQFPKGRGVTLSGRTGPKGWAHIRYHVPAGRTTKKSKKVVVVARPASGRPNVSTKTYFTIR